MTPAIHWSVIDGVVRAWVPDGTTCAQCRRLAMFFVQRMGSTRCVACDGEGR